MEELVRLKFADPQLRDLLLATGDAELIEGNDRKDRVWGCVKKAGVWVGHNHLGKILIRVREQAHRH